MASFERDLRSEERRVVSGGVRVTFSNPEVFEIDGRLMDVSASGFRMSHDCTALQSGQLVEFSHFEAQGRAQVMWNRILAGGIETGFRVFAH